MTRQIMYMGVTKQPNGMKADTEGGLECGMKIDCYCLSLFQSLCVLRDLVLIHSNITGEANHLNLLMQLTCNIHVTAVVKACAIFFPNINLQAY